MNPYFWCCERWAKKSLPTLAATSHPASKTSKSKRASIRRRRISPNLPMPPIPTGRMPAGSGTSNTESRRPACRTAIWDLTAFLKIMTSLSLEEYRRQVEASDGHSHIGRRGTKPKWEASPTSNIPTTQNRIPTSTALISTE